MKTLFIFAITIICTLPAVGAAQNRTAIVLAAGPSLPLGKLRDTQISGFDADLGLVRGSDEAPIGLRLDLGYDQLPGRTVSGKKNPERKTISGTANIVFSFSGYTLKPYMIGGAGIFKMTPKLSGGEQTARFGFDFGLGFTLPVSEKAVFVESRVNSISQHNAKPLRYVPIALGFLF
jgi:hypothetical protein